MSALILTACIIWCICSIKSNRHKDGFHRLRQHHDEYEDEIRMMSTGSKKSLLSHEFQDETDTEEETLYSSKHWNRPRTSPSISTQQNYSSFWETLHSEERLSCFFKELWEVNLLNLYSLWIWLAVLNFPSFKYCYLKKKICFLFMQQRWDSHFVFLFNLRWAVWSLRYNCIKPLGSYILHIRCLLVALAFLF